VFLAEKPFLGCAGQVVTDEVRVTIAAQACLLLLGQAGGPPFPRLRQVLVYPGVFAAPAAQAADGGVVHESQRQALAGQSWAHGQVVLGWAEVLAGAADPGDGQNVVVHEFAHQIDQDKGVADGRPWLHGRARRRRWAAVMDEAFLRLRQQPSALIGAYAATAPAEFFAVVSERFYEQPLALAQAEPAVYRELALLYQVHPLAW
jgi:Mlc titration factor MtfA (ptsG expression regulator)